MENTKAVERVVGSFTIEGTNTVVKGGDFVVMRPAEDGVNAYVGCVEEIMDKSMDVRVRWFYRPEETEPGRMSFQGEKELLLSDHVDIQNAHCIFGKCSVHSFEDYCKLEEVGDVDYYWRHKYDHYSQNICPGDVQVYCLCEKPYNPDKLMIQCEECMDWFHPECLCLKTGKATRENLVCSKHCRKRKRLRSLSS